MLEESDDSSEFRNIQGLVASYEFGRNITNPNEMCLKYFPCQNSNYDQYDTDLLCPGAKIGCALCGQYLPDSCEVVCPIAGFYCGKYFNFTLRKVPFHLAVYLGHLKTQLPFYCYLIGRTRNIFFL